MLDTLTQSLSATKVRIWSDASGQFAHMAKFIGLADHQFKSKPANSPFYKKTRTEPAAGNRPPAGGAISPRGSAGWPSIPRPNRPTARVGHQNDCRRGDRSLAFIRV
jgi:hypothetical protein